VFKSSKRGLFSFSLENGIGLPPDGLCLFKSPAVYIVEKTSLSFGDIWVYDEVLKETELIDVLSAMLDTQEDTDTLLSSVAYKLFKHGQPSAVALNWYEDSYASFLYPRAQMNSRRLSEFRERLGDENVLNQFLAKYIEYILKSKIIDTKNMFPILIDSTGLPNSIKSTLATLNNHNGVINEEIRLIYVVDQKTNLPVYFRYIPGNIVDVSTLHNTIKELQLQNVDIKMLILDAGYLSESNINTLFSTKISFITRLIPNRKLYKQLLLENTIDMQVAADAVMYRNRVLFVKKVPVTLNKHLVYAYIIRDLDRFKSETINNISKMDPKKDSLDEVSAKLQSAGYFILISDKDLDNDKILPLYYQRQIIEQVFDASKNFADLLPLRVHSDNGIRAQLLLSFIATIVYILTNNKLKESKYCAATAFSFLETLRIKIFEDGNKIIMEKNKDQNEIVKHLKLMYPFNVQFNGYDEEFVRKNTGVSKRKRGRPKGSKAKKSEYANPAGSEPLKSGDSKITQSDKAASIKKPGDKPERGRPAGKGRKAPIRRSASAGSPAVRPIKGQPAGHGRKAPIRSGASEGSLSVKLKRGRPAGNGGRKAAIRGAASVGAGSSAAK
jgi:hypothetical protein